MFVKKSITEIRAALRRGVVVPMEPHPEFKGREFEDFDIFAPREAGQADGSGEK
jgi:hypothetical protein